MLKGAELILTPNAYELMPHCRFVSLTLRRCYLDPIRLAQFMIRGWENTLGVAMTNVRNFELRNPIHMLSYNPIALDGRC